MYPSHSVALLQPSHGVGRELQRAHTAPVLHVKSAGERLQDVKTRDLNASHDRRLQSLGLETKKKRSRKKATALAKASQLDGFDDNCNTGFVHYKMETEAEFSMHKLWLTKRAEEMNHQKAQGEVKWALEQWAMNKSRMETEISRRQESRRYASQFGLRQIAEHIPGHPLGPPGQTGKLKIATPIVIPRKPKNAGIDSLNQIKSVTGSQKDTRVEEDSSRVKMNASYSMNVELDSKPVRLTPYSTSAPLGNLWNARLNSLKEAGGDNLEADDPELMVIRGEIDGRQAAKGPSPNCESTGILQPGVWSSARFRQLDECKRIERQLDRHSLACSTNTIERALMIPEDRPKMECISNLPVPGTHLPENPMAKEVEEAAKKKGSKKKAGSKKKGKKKGKSKKKKKKK